jgi:hypothetical protein
MSVHRAYKLVANSGMADNNRHGSDKMAFYGLITSSLREYAETSTRI